ncbi:hypothetical protein EIP91_009278, partial [Steccherinum ochraceum]
MRAAKSSPQPSFQPIPLLSTCSTLLQLELQLNKMAHASDLFPLLTTPNLPDGASEIHPLAHLPCANHDVGRAWVCPNV